MPKIKAFCAVTTYWGADDELVDACLPDNYGASATSSFFKETRKQASDRNVGTELPVTEQEAVYIYEIREGGESYTGVWALTALADFLEGRIKGHQQVNVAHAHSIATCQRLSGFEASPVLITYLADPGIDVLIALAKSVAPLRTWRSGQQTHLLWRISEQPLIRQLIKAFGTLGTVFLAEGHDRLCGIENGPEHGGTSAALRAAPATYFSSLYMAEDQLRSLPCHQFIKPGFPVDSENFFQVIRKHFEVRVSPGNRPLEPVRAHQFGLHLDGCWYQLELKQAALAGASFTDRLDSNILHRHILSPACLLSGSEQGVRSISGRHALRELVAQTEEDRSLVAFTLYPVSLNQLISIAYLDGLLPPKMTCIEPKVPLGMLMCHFNPAAI